ncbi:hypothetical protein B0H14DRAFT_2571924 [Mycena olivaceomarginata]|nr:hypothetical protein B0H14DRAFT_2571924 [Mycena olivaceomarginata]
MPKMHMANCLCIRESPYTPALEALRITGQNTMFRQMLPKFSRGNAQRSHVLTTLTPAQANTIPQHKIAFELDGQVLKEKFSTIVFLGTEVAVNRGIQYAWDIARYEKKRLHRVRFQPTKNIHWRPCAGKGPGALFQHSSIVNIKQAKNYDWNRIIDICRIDRWQERIESRPDAPLAIQAGARAYALKQAAWHAKLAGFFWTKWNISALTAAQQLVAVEGVELDNFFGQ